MKFRALSAIVLGLALAQVSPAPQPPVSNDGASAKASDTPPRTPVAAWLDSVLQTVIIRTNGVTCTTHELRTNSITEAYIAAIKTAAEKGDAIAEFKLGWLYSYAGIGTTNRSSGLEWIRKAAEHGQPDAQVHLGSLLLRQKPAEALKWYRKAAEQGSPPGQQLLADCYIFGLGVETNLSESLLWYERAAHNGDLEAQKMLGFLYAGGSCFKRGDRRYFESDGNGPAKDKVKAVHWYRQAAEQGDADAQYALAGLCATGDGTKKDEPEALKWYRKAAEQNHLDAQVALAWRLFWGGSQGHKECAKWASLAAAQGDTSAQTLCATLYLQGWGVPKDFAAAVRFCRSAADKGDPTAQNDLGAMYANGTGLLQDYVEAAKWFRRAAEQGDPKGQMALGQCYADGSGVSQNFPQAYKWFNLASVSEGNVQDYLGAAEARDRIARRMTPEQIAEGQRLSASFTPHKSTEIDAYPTGPNGPPSNTSRPGRPTTPRFSGTGFFVTTNGYLLTSFHIVENAARLKLKHNDAYLPATLVKSDAANDIAVLKVSGLFTALSLAPSKGVKLGASAFTLGFPNTELQGFEPKITRGEISGLAGAQDDPRHFQISIPVQPGNSGGPLLSDSGVVLGIIEAKLSARLALKTSGALPENVNYALKSSYALLLLDSIPDAAYKLAQPDSKPKPLTDVIADSQKAIVLVLAY